MDAQQWISAYAAELGVDPPTNDELKRLLDVAGVAAHSSERIAAPITCWLGGRAGASIEEMEAAAQRTRSASE